ncbi:hypothetical protein [Azospirillum doebereinerae]
MPALASVLALAVLLLWSGGVSAMPGHRTSGHTMPGHAVHEHAMHQQAGQTAVPVAVLSMPDGVAPCHHGADRTLPPCCVGLACAAMHVGLVAEALPAPEPGRGPEPTTGASLWNGVRVPPDLPPPRLG